MLIRLIIYFFIISSAATALAEDLLSCVDPDVRQALVSHVHGGDTVISRELPEAFEAFQVPESFDYIGSSVSEFQTMVAYKTSLETGPALERAMESLAAAGWKEIRNRFRLSGGFRSKDIPSYSTLCRDDRTFSMTARRAVEATFVNMTTASRQVDPSCDALISPQTLFDRDRGLSQHMPALSLPEGAKAARGVSLGAIMGGVSSDNRTSRTSITVSTALSAQELMDDFARQLDEQGWRIDAQWSGRLAVGSTWSAQPDDTLSLFAALDIVGIDESIYQAYFRITKFD